MFFYFSMVGVPTGNNPTSLSEIAEACHDYDNPNNLTSFKNVYMTDGSRAGNGTSTALKYTQFIGKNVAYDVTSTGLLATGTQDQEFSGWSSFAASRGLEYFMLSRVNNSFSQPRVFTSSGAVHATLRYLGLNNSTFYITNHGRSLAVDRTGIMLVGHDRNGSSVTFAPRNALFMYYTSQYFSSASWSGGYDVNNGFGTKLGHLVNSGGYLYIPTSGGVYPDGRTVTIMKVAISNSMLVDTFYYGAAYFFGYSIQLSENLDRFVIDGGPGSNVSVYKITGEDTNEIEYTLTTTGGTGHVYCNSDCSVVVSGSSIWHRSGTTWTAANTTEIANRNIDAQSCDISDDGTRVVYKRISGSANTNDPNSGNQLNHFHYHKTNNKWYYTGNSNLGSTPALYRFLGGGFRSTNIGVRNDGYVIGKRDSGSGSKPQVYKGTIGVKK